MPRTLTLTTDFGTRDAYVAAMKGVMLNVCPGLRFVDVTHDISPQDVMEAAFVLRQAAPFFPEDTVHLVVVDPGVGTERKPVALRHDGRWFVGPDNGLFALVLGDDAPDAAVVLDEPAVWRTPAPSTTFHGRDLFAPAAAHLAAGRPLASLGSPLNTLTPLRWAQPIADEEGVQGWTVHIDRFGNCITNVSRGLIEAHARSAADSAGGAPAGATSAPEVSVFDQPVKCFVGSTILNAIHPTYGAVAMGEPLLLFGSSGFLEIAVNGGNAAELLGIRKGETVNLVFQDDPVSR